MHALLGTFVKASPSQPFSVQKAPNNKLRENLSHMKDLVQPRKLIKWPASQPGEKQLQHDNSWIEEWRENSYKDKNTKNTNIINNP